MYRSVEQIVNALHTGKTTLKSMRNSVSRYRKLGHLGCVIMYMTAIETYLHEVRFMEDIEIPADVDTADKFVDFVRS